MRTALVAFVLLVVAGTPAAAQSGDQALRERIDSVVSARVAAGEFSGVVLVARGDRVIYERAAGLADPTRGVPMTMDTRLQIASATKLYTQIAVYQLVQRGRLSLDDTVGKFLPEYPNPTVRSTATVAQLLAHRSGIGSFWNAAWMERRASVMTVDDYLRLFWDDALLFPPGEGEAYSNGGYVVLGAIIERVSGQRYHEYLREHVFTPAGMTSTAPGGRSVSYPNAATGYTRQPMGASVPPGTDTRLAGTGAGVRRMPPTSGAAGDSQPGPRRVLRGPDGREMTEEERRQMRARMASMPRQPNTDFQPGLTGPAGDHFSTAADYLRLARALTSGRLLDSAHTTLLRPRGDRTAAFRANGGGPGVNAEFSVLTGGEVVVVLSNYDPPAATEVATFIRALIAHGEAARHRP